MRPGWIALTALACAAALPTASAGAVPRPTIAKDWTRAVVATPAGGFRMGNPAAKVKLIEYGSLTCPHCAHFAAEGTNGIRALVKSGRVSFEFRNFLLNGPDIAATLLARCGGARTFFPTVDAMYASQPQWVGAIAGIDEQQKAEIEGLPLKQRIVRLAKAGGLPQLVAKTGVPAARAQQCLTDETAMAALEKLNADGRKLGVAGTPTFFINGEKVKAITWADLEPDIRSALGTGG
jgi:protein-disulfide isomerase